jgi:hypothetical protein
MTSDDKSIIVLIINQELFPILLEMIDMKTLVNMSLADKKIYNHLHQYIKARSENFSYKLLKDVITHHYISDAININIWRNINPAIFIEELIPLNLRLNKFGTGRLVSSFLKYRSLLPTKYKGLGKYNGETKKLADEFIKQLTSNGIFNPGKCIFTKMEIYCLFRQIYEKHKLLQISNENLLIIETGICANIGINIKNNIINKFEYKYGNI